MLDDRKDEWLGRFRAGAPAYLSLALAALIALELARAAISILSGPVRSPAPVLARSAPAAKPRGVDAQSVVSQHLFGIAAVDANTQDPASAPLSSANLILTGTIATQDPKRGVAIISDGGPAKVYSVGDNVAGATLYSVYLDHVILNRVGSLETLLLPRQLAATQPPIVRRPGGDARTVAAVDSIRRMVQQDPGLLDQVMRTVPSYDNVAGRMRGFRAYPGRNRQIFSKLGLKPGDLVTAINGAALDDPQRSQEVFNTIQSSDHATVTIERAGQKQDITLNIAQVAAQAARDFEGEPSSTSSVPGNPAAGAPPQPISSNENINE
ncbi:MAG: type II secretion system protein GspC [Pseudomonadota bacterium]|nr:type II secretion system protein GspC [Pseudomonadota bacterium]